MFDEEKLAAKAVEGGLHAVNGGKHHQDDAPATLANSEQYSEAMVDTIFADTLSRGMQNAITSQQNAQMASSTSITSACGRILNAHAAAKKTKPTPESKTQEDKKGRTLQSDADSKSPRSEPVSAIKADVTSIYKAASGDSVSSDLDANQSTADKPAISANPEDRHSTKISANKHKVEELDKAKLASGLIFALSLGIMATTGVLYFIS